MRRRAYLSSLAVSSVALAGCSVLADSRDRSQPGYYGTETVVDGRDDLDIALREEPVRLGDTLEFEITNTGDTSVTLGCNNPWAIQKRSDGDWQHVTWTGERYYDMCSTSLSAGESRVERITLSVSELETQASEVKRELTPGEYRFLLVGTSPYVARSFDVLADSGTDSEKSASPADELSITVADASVSPGETTRVSIEATSVGSMRFRKLPESPTSDPTTNGIEFDFDQAAFDPGPETVWEAHPPTWQWGSAARIEGEVPVRIDSDVPPGEYQFSISVWWDDFENRRAAHGKITVQDP